MAVAVEAQVQSAALYEEFVNPQWARLLDVLRMNVKYTRCCGTLLETEDGRTILDFNSGYCVHNIGHNHPHVVDALKRELNAAGPAMLQNHVADLAGLLAARLCELSGGRLAKVFFASSGSEGIEAVIKFARAHTGRAGMLYAAGAFHGLTCGALSLMSDPFWRDGFGPLLPGTAAVSFDDIDELEAKLATRSFAALVLEPIQAEAGVILPSADYLYNAQTLCRRYGTLFVLDEVQTGLHRTGHFIAAHHYRVEPDMIVLAKALSGGLIPCSAVLMSDAIYTSVYGSLKRAIIHTSTYSENSLAMRAGLATLEVLQNERLGERAGKLGDRMRGQLGRALGGYEMVRDIRGAGLLNAIEFCPPRSLRLRMAFEAISKIHPAVFGQMVVMQLFREHGILTQICGNNFMVLKVAPPLTTTDAQIDQFVAAIKNVAELMHNSAMFWSQALGIAHRAFPRSSSNRHSIG